MAPPQAAGTPSAQAMVTAGKALLAAGKVWYVPAPASIQTRLHTRGALYERLASAAGRGCTAGLRRRLR